VDVNNAIFAAADCDGDGEPNGTDSDPYDPCVGGDISSIDLTDTEILMKSMVIIMAFRM